MLILLYFWLDVKAMIGHDYALKRASILASKVHSVEVPTQQQIVGSLTKSTRLANYVLTFKTTDLSICCWIFTSITVRRGV